MQPLNFNAGNEALRCLSFAENLLSNREFSKAKQFATRALESDPRMEQSEQMLAIADTMIVSEKLLNNEQVDWYRVLQVERYCCDSELVGTQFRRLSDLLNPRINRFPFAENAFKMVNDAYVVLSNPVRKFEFDSLVRNVDMRESGLAGYDFIQGESGVQQRQEQQQQRSGSGSTHFSFIQEHSEQLRKQHQLHYEQQQQEQQLFTNQPVEYLNEAPQQHWLNQGQQVEVQQHWSQNHQPPQQLHWSQLQPEQGVHWSQQVLPRQTQVLTRTHPQPEQHWAHHQHQQPMHWHHSHPQQPSPASQQQKTFPQPQPEPSHPQPPIQQPLPWHHSQQQQSSTRPVPQKPLRHPTQPQTQLLLPKSPPPRQQQQPQLYQPLAQQPLPWHHSQPQQPLAPAEPEPPQYPLPQPTPPSQNPLPKPTPQPQNPFPQPTPTLQNPLRQPTPTPQNPLREPTPPPPQNPLREPTPPPKLQQRVIQLPVPKLEPQPQEQLTIASHQSKQQQPSVWPQLQQILSQSPSPPPPQQQQPPPRPEPSLPQTQPLVPQPMLNPVVQTPSPKPQLPFPGSEQLQHSPQLEPQLQSLPQSQPQLQSHPQLQPQSLPQQPQPESQPTLQPQSESLEKSQPRVKSLAKLKPQTQSMKPQAESQDRGRNGNFQEPGQQARQVAGEKSGNDEGNPQTDVSSFWTGCPYCYNLYEYPKRYAECTLRCQNCKRGFHAVEISTPPSATEGKEDYFCSWALFPFGATRSYFDHCKAAASTWTPISNMFVVPQVENGSHAGKQKNKKPNAGPWIIIDEDQDSVPDVPSKEDSDEDWHISKKKKGRSPNGKGSTSKKVKPPKVNKSNKVKGSNIGNSQPVRAAQDGEGFGVPNMEVPIMPVGDPSNIAAGVVTRNRPGGAGKNMGKLDLNVEFSNEVDDPAKGTSGGSPTEQGVEDNAEGTAFFEGLDEFLDSLPILSVDGSDKVKAG